MKKNENQESQIRRDAESAIDPRVDLAVERTELALERTQLSWVRTLLSLIGGGFILDKGMEEFHNARIASGEAWLKNTHASGLFITGTGTFLMIIVTIYYIKRSQKLAFMRGYKKFLFAPGLLISVLTILIGLVLIYFITS
jgi:uncharacterized membrane protein YidH (DUF202 family)